MVDEEVAAVRATDGAADPGQRHGGALEGRGGQGGRGPDICLAHHRVACSSDQSIVILYDQEIVKTNFEVAFKTVFFSFEPK